MKVITTSTPDWFKTSNNFILEEDSSNVHYKSVKERIYDYSKFPTFTLPSNKILSTQTKRYSLYKSLEGSSTRLDPLNNYGHTHFTSMEGIPPGSVYKKYINGYPNSKYIAFRDFGGTYKVPATYTYSANSDGIQWINGENTVGYSIADETERAAIEALMNTAKAAQPSSKFGIYSIQTFNNTLNKWYESENTEASALTLVGYLTTPPSSPQVDAGFNLLMEDLYSTYFRGTDDFPAYYIYLKQIAKKQFQLTGNAAYSKMLAIFWTQSEFAGLEFIWKRKDGFVVRCGEGGSIDGKVKTNAYIDHAYNLGLACTTIGDGLVGWESVDIATLAYKSENVNGSSVDTEKMSTGNIQATLDGDIFLIDPARTWKGSQMFVTLAAYQASLHKTIIEGTTYDWDTPDFIYNGGTLRTGIYKTIPYNKFYKEPVVMYKYSNDKSECLIYACNFWNGNQSSDNVANPKHLIVKIQDSLGVTKNISILLKNKKAELVKVIF